MMFRAGPKSQWACGSKPSAAKSRGVPQRRTSGLSFSSSPTGVVASGMFGMESMSVVAWRPRPRRGASPRAVSFVVDLRARVSLVALASSVLPWPMSAPISFEQLVALGLQGLFLGDDLAALHIKGGELLRREGGVAVLHRFGDLVEVLAYVLDVQHGAALFHNDRLPGTPTIRRFSMRPSIAPPAGAGGKSSGAAGAGGQKSG